MTVTKLSKVKAAAFTGDWREAIRLAAKFHELGTQKEAITRAWNAYQSPDFYRDLGENPDALTAAGITALKERYGI